MTVTAQIPVNSYTANGVTTVFNFTFLLLAPGDLDVYVDDVLKTLGVDYSVSGLEIPAGGTVTFTTAPENGANVVLQRNSDIARATDYQNNGDMLAAVVNKDFDRLWLAMQEILYKYQLAPSLVPGSPLAGEIRLPNPEVGKYLRWNIAENNLENADPGFYGGTIFPDGAVIATAADLALTPVVAGKTYYLKEYHAGTGKGGDELVGVAGSTTYDNGITFAGSGGYFRRINYEFLTSDMFGVTSTGTNLQAFLDACAGQYAQLSPGTYTLSSKHTVRPDTVLFGSDAALKMGNSFATLQSFFVADDGAVIYGIEFDGNYANNASHNVAMCEIGNFARFENCEFTKIPYIGLAPLTDGDTCYVSDCRFIADAATTATVGSYLGLWYDAPNVTVYCNDCYFEGFRINGIFVGGYSVINNPKLYNCHKQTSPVGGGHIASGNNVVYCQINDPIIDGNNNAAATGIELDNLNMHVSGGFIKNCGFFGVIVQSGEGHSVTGVTCYDNGISGIQCGSNIGSDIVRRFVVDGNTCYGNNKGIVVDTSVGNKFIVSNNICYDNTASDIQILRETADCIVQNNLPLASNLNTKVVSSEIAPGSAVAMASSATTYNLTSISLVAGTWDVEYVAVPVPNTTTQTTVFTASISEVSATEPSYPGAGAVAIWKGVSTTGNSLPNLVAQKRITLAAPATIYATVRATFTTSTMSAYGYIIAKRVY